MILAHDPVQGLTQGVKVQGILLSGMGIRLNKEERVVWSRRERDESYPGDILLVLTRLLLFRVSTVSTGSD